jgi:hypothetical protein
VAAVFAELRPNVLVREDSSVVLRVAADKGASTTKVIISFTLVDLSNSPFSFFPLAIYDG